MDSGAASKAGTGASPGAADASEASSASDWLEGSASKDSFMREMLSSSPKGLLTDTSTSTGSPTTAVLSARLLSFTLLAPSSHEATWMSAPAKASCEVQALTPVMLHIAAHHEADCLVKTQLALNGTHAKLAQPRALT